jgi:hypothetical protein
MRVARESMTTSPASHSRYALGSMCAVDALRRNDIERARRTPPAVRARQALAARRTGIALRRQALCAAHPAASENEIEVLLRRWLARDE